MIVKTRSPYIVYSSQANLDFVEMKLYVYIGTSVVNRPATPTYILNATAQNNEAYFDISEFIRDFFVSEFNGEYASDVVFAVYQLTKTVNAIVQPPESFVLLDCYDGYGFFEEGENPQFETPLMLSCHRVLKPEGYPARIPVVNDLTDSIGLESKSKTVYELELTSTALSSQKIGYISTSSDGADTFPDRVIRDDDTAIIEENTCLTAFFKCFPNYVTDKVFIREITTDEVTKLIVDSIPIREVQPLKVVFINKHGAKQDLWFFGNHKLRTKATGDEFKANVLNSSGGYDKYKHQYRKLNINARRTIKLNSGFYPEECNVTFEEFIYSEYAWIDFEGEILPLVVNTKNFEFKKHYEDNLINYVFEADFGFDRINSVR